MGDCGMNEIDKLKIDEIVDNVLNKNTEELKKRFYSFIEKHSLFEGKVEYEVQGDLDENTDLNVSMFEKKKLYEIAKKPFYAYVFVTEEDGASIDITLIGDY